MTLSSISEVSTERERSKVVSIAKYIDVQTLQAQQEKDTSVWQEAAVRKLTQLVGLPTNWDGYGAPSIDRQVAMFALEILQKVMSQSTPVPTIVPSSVGGVQIEWHTNMVDLEIHVVAPYQGTVYFCDGTADDPVEFMITKNVEQISPLVARLMLPLHAPLHASAH